MQLMRGDRVSIVISPQPEPMVEQAARELEHHLRQIGITASPVTAASARPPAIVLQPEAAVNFADDIAGLSRDGCILRTIDPGTLVIAGPGERAVLNGVYMFLEKVLGFRWLTPTVTHLPAQTRFDLSGIRMRYDPPFAYRSLHNIYAWNSDWAARHRLNYFVDHNPRQFLDDPRLRDSFYFAGKEHCHNVYELLALGCPETDGATMTIKDVFARHPDYFCLLNGKHQMSTADKNRPAVSDQSGQICLTHPDMDRLLVRGIRRLIESDPGASFVALSLRDNYDYCQCDTCRAAAARLGGMNHVFFELANRVAAGIEPIYPHILINLLAYHGTQPPPGNLHLHPNIQIRYCPIRISQYHAFDESEHNTVGGLNFETPPSMARPAEQLRQWRRLCKHIMCWYYTLHLPELQPQPSLRAHDRNLRMMQALGVEGVFIEDLYVEENALNPVRAYVLASLLWDPAQDLDQLVKEFVGLYYREAAGAVLEYIRLLHDSGSWDWENWPEADGRSRWSVKDCEESWGWFGEKPDPAIYQTPHFFTLYGTRPPLKPVFFDQAARILNGAESGIRDNPELRSRLDLVRMPVLYAARKQLPPEHPLQKEAERVLVPFLEVLRRRYGDRPGVLSRL
ncbi:MAG: DUF4838 domain-containing protein [Kiritimatiellaeota bacterium]|nr:DUF4838 domain-containing protein [Kiritimatiellota bacterium]